VELMLAGRYRLMSWTMTPGIAKSTTVKTSMTLVKIESEAPMIERSRRCPGR